MHHIATMHIYPMHHNMVHTHSKIFNHILSLEQVLLNTIANSLWQGSVDFVKGCSAWPWDIEVVCCVSCGLQSLRPTSQAVVGKNKSIYEVMVLPIFIPDSDRPFYSDAGILSVHKKQSRN